MDIKIKKPDTIIGTHVGIFNILDICDHRANDGHKLYRVKCAICGKEANMKKSDIIRTSHCTHIGRDGCYINYNTRWKNKRIGNIFSGMKDRCFNSKNKYYNRYGGRGITICDEWLNNPILFEEWAIENGYNDQLTIDRIDVNGDYCPNNCRWVTGSFNSKYKSTTRLIDVDGEIHSGRDWSTLLGFGKNLINTYIRIYGLENTKEFIRFHRCFKDQPSNSESYYNMYMNSDTLYVYVQK